MGEVQRLSVDLSLYYDTSNPHTHSMTNPHSSPPYLVTSLSFLPHSQVIPTFLRAGHSTSLLISFTCSHFTKNQTQLFSQTFSLYFKTLRLIFKLYSSLGKYNSSSLWLLHLILLKSLISYTNIITFLLDLRTVKWFFKCSWVEHFFSPSSIFWNHSRWVHTPLLSYFLKL